MPLRLLTYPEQVAAHLRSEILGGRWTGEIAGVDRLAAELKVNRTTIGSALVLLEKEGLLVRRGIGRRRQIALPEIVHPTSLRVALLLYESIEAKVDYIVDLQHRLIAAGHVSVIPPKSLLELKMDVGHISRLVSKTKADAWVIQAGSTDVLEWFAAQATPAFALAGRRRGVNIAGTGPDKMAALQSTVRRLLQLGHRRIVMLAREERRKPSPGLMERAFLDELEAFGIATGPYNLPDWEDSQEALYGRLDSLFRHTPPTALIIGEVPLFLAVERHLARLGFLAPKDVSLICLDPSSSMKWFQPMVTHINWDSEPMIRRIVRWANNVARGKNDRRQSFTNAEFMEGGTIGPVPQ